MKQVCLRPRGAFVAPPRSDTLFGLIAHGIRTAYGRASVERFLAPALDDPPQAPLYLTSCFPFLDSEKNRVHFFPAPASPATSPADHETAYIEDAEFLTWLSGRGKHPQKTAMLDGFLATDRDDRGAPRAALSRGGFFFLASGPAEHYLEAALRVLERSGFGGGASRGLSQFDVELREVDFVRLAQPGEVGILLSLLSPTAEEREAMAREARADPRIAWRIERRQGAPSGAFGASPEGLDRPNTKEAIALVAEGSVIPRAGGKACGSAPIVGKARDAAGEFPLLHGGFGFLLPLGMESAA